MGAKVQVAWPATVSQPLQREGRRAGTLLTLPQASGKPIRDVGEAWAWRQDCPFCLQSTFAKGFRALGEGGFAWGHGQVGLCLTHSCLWAPRGTRGGDPRDGACSSSSSSSDASGVRLQVLGTRYALGPCPNEPRGVLLSHAVPQGQEGNEFC